SFVSPPSILQDPSRVLTYQIRVRIRQTRTEPTRPAVALRLGDPHRVTGLPLARIGLNQEAHGPERQKPEGIGIETGGAVKSPLLRCFERECRRGQRVVWLAPNAASNHPCPHRRPTRQTTGDSYWRYIQGMYLLQGKQVSWMAPAIMASDATRAAPRAKRQGTSSVPRRRACRDAGGDAKALA